MTTRMIDQPIAAASESTSTRTWSSDLQQWFCFAERPVDIASATFFRIAFGCLTAAWSWDYLTSGRVTRLYVLPQFHFTYPGFEWLTPWSGVGMYVHFLVMLALSLCIAAGWFYRVAAVAFALCFTYFFLLERTNYQNHYYLMALVSWMLPLLPLNRNVSVDAWRRPEISSETAPAWVYWVIQFHIAIPYFFGGVAKLTPDWMLGQPMGMFLQTKAEFPIVGSWLSWPAMGAMLSWYGLMFDLLIVPALLWKKTRILAYLLCVVFHLGNSALFQIHVFPWFMIAATTIFFAPDWPRRILSGSTGKTEPEAASREAERVGAQATPIRWTLRKQVVLVLALLYAAFHCLWPLRSRLYGEETSWTERGHLFSWRMMLRAKEVGIGYAVSDPATGRVANVDHKQFIDPEQAEKFPRDPELILKMAHFIADKAEKDMGRRPQVYAFVLASLNGRKPQLMIDPNVDLAAQPLYTAGAHSWIVPLTEPFRSSPWSVPIEQWREHVELPEFKFMKGPSQGERN